MQSCLDNANDHPAAGPRRHVRKGLLRSALAFLLVSLANPSAGFAEPKAWQDGSTGLAIGGYDPLAYYTKGEPRIGRDGVELNWGGAIWRFLNTGNRDAFKKHPLAYAPRFAGYDAYALTLGRTTPGHPRIWVRHEDRIYLFHNAANLRLWQGDRDKAIKLAEERWPVLSADLPSSIGE